MASKQPLGKRFWSYVDIRGVDECWPWKGKLNYKGYGRFKYRNTTVGAHRVAYLLSYKKSPTGLCVCHACDNRMCVNPKHLWLGTIADNTLDMKAKGRARNKPRRGEASNWAVLTEVQVKEIRRIHAAKEMTMTEMAKKFGVRIPAISRIVARLRWAHIP